MCYYSPYRKRDGSLNPNFNKYSSKMLELKKNETEAISFWKNELGQVSKIQKALKNNEVAIAIVPSSSPYEKNLSGIGALGQELIKEHNDLIDAIFCLERYQKIDKLSQGGNRNIDVHLNSIQVVNSYLIQNKNVLLLDDVTTTGNSLNACRKLLREAGAKKILCLALAKTKR